jgi:hypothetical protein
MPKSTECEVRGSDGWERMAISDALLNRFLEMRCPECHGRVRAHKEGTTGQGAHFEHIKVHAGLQLWFGMERAEQPSSNSAPLGMRSDFECQCFGGTSLQCRAFHLRGRLKFNGLMGHGVTSSMPYPERAAPPKTPDVRGRTRPVVRSFAGECLQRERRA